MSRATYINRPREPEWRKVIARTGFEIAHWEPRVWPLPVGFDHSHPNPRWAAVSAEESAMGQILVALKPSGAGS